MRKSQGTPLTKWLGEIPKEIKDKCPFLVWREFWNDDFTPQDAILKVK
tara:strand:+ start:871 stop:1014 length:144 start_codon:yes stop_codon:yes gene_type:complete